MTLSNERIFLYTLYSLGLVLWFVLWKFLSSILVLFLTKNEFWHLSLEQWTAIISVAISLAVVQAVWKNQKAKEYGVDVVVETKKVSWPNRKELQGSTIIVLVMVFVVAVIIYLLDKIFDFLIRLLFQL